MIMKKLTSILLALAMVFALTACSGGEPQNTNTPPAPTGSESVTPSQPQERVVTVTDMSGDEITVTGEVNSIINLWPAGTSSFFVMGAGDLLSAVAVNTTGAMDSWVKYFYPNAAEIPAMGGTSPAVEDIVAKSPDLVIVHPTTVSAGLPQQIRDMGIPAMNINFSTYEEMIQAYTVLGEVLGGEYQEKLATWCGAVQDKIADHRELVSSLADEDKPVVYYIAGQSDDLLTTMGVGSIMQDWVESNGGIFASTMLELASGNTVTAEEVFQLDPDIIIVGGVNQHTLMAQLESTAGWKDLSAVKDGRVYNNPYGCFNWDRFGLESLLQLDYALLRTQPELAEQEGITEESMVQEIIDFYAYYNGAQMTAEEAANMLNGLLADGTAEVPAK